MIRLRDIPISYKLTGIVMFVSCTALLVASAVFVISDRIASRDALVAEVNTLAAVLGGNSTAALVYGSVADANEILGVLSAQSDIIAARIYTEDNRPFATYRRVGAETISLPERPLADGHIFGDDRLTLSRTIELSGRTVGALYIEHSLGPLEARVQRYIILVAITVLVSLLVALAVVTRLRRLIVEPIHSLSEVAMQISTTRDYSIRVESSSKDELGYLVEHFNSMLAEIQQRDVALREAHDGLELQVAARTGELSWELAERSRAEAEKRTRLERIQKQRMAITRLTSEETQFGADFERAAQNITEIVADAMRADRVSIWLMDHEHRHIKCVDLLERSSGQHSCGSILKEDDFPTYFEAICEERILAATDARTDSRTREFKEGYLEPQGITSMLDAAVRMSGAFVGVVSFEQVGSERIWRGDEITFADEIASQVAQTYASIRRRQTEIALAKSRELLKATLESTADGILVVNREGEATHANALFSEMWRIPPDLMASREDSKLLEHILDQLSDPDVFLRRVKELYQSIDESLDQISFKDGRTFERFSCPLIQDEQVAGRVWSFRDVSERMRAEDALRASQQKLLLHVQQTPLAVIEWDLNFEVTEWNQAAEQIFGYSREEAMGRHAAGLIVPDHAREGVDQVWTDLMANRGSSMSTNDNIAVNGHVVTCEWYNTPLVDDAGKAIGVASLVLDVTEQTRAQKTRAVLLKISEAANQVENLEELLAIVHRELGTLIDTTNFYVALYDQDSEMYSFPFYRDIYDGDNVPTEALKNSLTDYVRRTGEHLLVDEETLAGLEERGEAEMVGPTSAIWLGIPLKTSSETIGVMVVQDYEDPNAYSQSDSDWLTSVADPVARVIERNQAKHQQQELREQLERAERMESLGVLAGGVAHDLNNMLGPLVGYPELILMKLPEESPVRRQVQRISNSARGAAEVVQDLLTLARRGRYEMVPTNVNEIVESYLDSPSFDQLQQANSNIKVDVRLGDSLDQIHGSSPHLYKVIMNLIVNAFDAMPSGGELTISTSQSCLEALLSGYDRIGRGDYVILRVRDTGIGIDAKDIEKIFEPYYSKKRMGSSGSGLGLSVVYGVVKDHKGYYDILSEPGQGAEFVLYFPATRVIEEQGKLAPVKIDGSESILVIDDDAALREMAAELVSSLGYHVDTVASGREAVAWLQENSADLLLLDMIMEPDCDGLETYREIIKSEPDQKAIIVSGYSSTDRVIKTQSLGAGALVKKPYNRATIGLAIRNELDRAVEPANHSPKSTSETA